MCSCSGKERCCICGYDRSVLYTKQYFTKAEHGKLVNQAVQQTHDDWRAHYDATTNKLRHAINTAKIEAADNKVLYDLACAGNEVLREEIEHLECNKEVYDRVYEDRVKLREKNERLTSELKTAEQWLTLADRDVGTLMSQLGALLGELDEYKDAGRKRREAVRAQVKGLRRTFSPGGIVDAYCEAIESILDGN